MIQPRGRATRALPALPVLALALGACGLDPFGPSSPAGDLRAARAEWERQGIDSYRYTLYRTCGECLPEWAAPARVEVRGGRTVSVVAASSARQIQPESFRQHDTVEELFAVVGAAIERDPYRLRARYDSRRGFPASYAVDFERDAVDDESGFTVADFEVIE